MGPSPGTGRAADGVPHRRARPLRAPRRRGRYAPGDRRPFRRADPACASTPITGHLAGAIVAVEEDLPLEATVFGAPPAIVPNLVVQLDAAALPERVVLWPLSILPLLLAVVLVIGAVVGYPVFRPTSEVDVVSSPARARRAGPGRLRAAASARRSAISPTRAAPLIVVRPGPKRQRAHRPAAVGRRTAPRRRRCRSAVAGRRGRIGWVYTVSEAVPALRLRAESIDATLLFAKTGERDRVAGLIAVDRD